MESEQNQPDARPDSVIPLQSADSPQEQPPIENYVTVTLKVIGGIHLTWAVVYIVLGLVDGDGNGNVLGNIGGPIFLVIGSFSLTAALMKNKKLIMLTMIFSIICAMACGVMLIIASLKIDNYGYGCCYYDGRRITSVVILIGTLIEGGISTGSAVVCAKSMGYRCPACVTFLTVPYNRMPEPSVSPSSDVTRVENGVGHNQGWSYLHHVKPGVATPAEAGIEPPAYEAQPQSN